MADNTQQQGNSPTNSLGFPQGDAWQNWQGTGGNKGTPIDIGQLLGTLLSKNAPDPSSASSSLGPATLTQLGNVGANTGQGQSGATGPYQKGVAKALQEYGYKHGAEALMSGMPAQSIQNHELMTGGENQINPQAIAVLKQLMQGQGQNQNPQIGAGQTPPPQSANDGMTPIQQQAGDLVSQPKNLLQGLLQGFAQGTGFTGQRLENLGKAQQIQGGSPEGKAQLAQAANMNAQTEYQRLTNQGQKPIDPEQYLGAYSNMYQKAYDAYSKDEESGNQITQSALDQYNKLADTTRNYWQKATGQPNAQMQATLQASAASLKASIDARANFHNFMLSNSPSQVIGSIKDKIAGGGNQGNSSSGVSGLKVGDKFNGEKIVNIKQVK